MYNFQTNMAADILRSLKILDWYGNLSDGIKSL